VRAQKVFTACLAQSRKSRTADRADSLFFSFRMSLRSGVFSDDFRNHESESVAIRGRASNWFGPDEVTKQLK
jgi:hypothetical protein